MADFCPQVYTPGFLVLEVGVELDSPIYGTFVISQHFFALPLHPWHHATRHLKLCQGIWNSYLQVSRSVPALY